MRNHCKVAQRQISVRIWWAGVGGGGEEYREFGKIIAYARTGGRGGGVVTRKRTGGGGGSKSGEFGRNTFWMVPQWKL